MDRRSITHQILQYKPIGYQDIGRPRRRWEDYLWNGTGQMAYLEVYDDDNEQARWPNPRDVQRTPCIS